MDKPQLLEAINSLPKNPIEWDTAILAEKIKPILAGILNIALAGGNVQSDWNQTNTDAADFIKNKPAIKVFDVRWYPDTRIPRPGDDQNAEIAGYIQAGKLNLVCMRHYEESTNSYIVWPVISGYYDAANKKLQYTVQIPEEMSGGTGSNKTATFTYVEENITAVPVS